MLKLTYENFWEEYPRLVALVFSPITETDGFSETELVQAEQRLELKIPAMLREFYLRAGKHRSNYVYNSLIPPAELQLYEDRYVGFFEENQGVYVIAWDTQSTESNPPTLISFSRGADWQPDSEEMSSCFAKMFLIQATHGDALPYLAYDETLQESFEELTEDWIRIESKGALGAVKEKAALLFFPPEDASDTGTLYAACTTKEDAEAIGEALEIELDVYETLDEAED